LQDDEDKVTSCPDGESDPDTEPFESGEAGERSRLK
jgi:hypothetical protein